MIRTAPQLACRRTKAAYTRNGIKSRAWQLSMTRKSSPQLFPLFLVSPSTIPIVLTSSHMCALGSPMPSRDISTRLRVLASVDSTCLRTELLREGGISLSSSSSLFWKTARREEENKNHKFARRGKVGSGKCPFLVGLSSRVSTAQAQRPTSFSRRSSICPVVFRKSK